jgi:hypothetical protein
MERNRRKKIERNRKKKKENRRKKTNLLLHNYFIYI